MSRQIAYFADGEIIECDCGKNTFRRHIAIHQKYSLTSDKRVWFRPCAEWIDTVKRTLDSWARQRGFVSWDAYRFINDVLKEVSYDD